MFGEATKFLESLDKKPIRNPKWKAEKRLSEGEIATSVDRALGVLDRICESRKKPKLRGADREKMAAALASHARESFHRPTVDAQKLIAAAEFTGFKASRIGKSYFASIDGIVVLACMEGGPGDGAEEAADDDDGFDWSSAPAYGLFAIDLTLEVIGLVCGLAGLRVPKTDPSLFEQPFAQMLKNKEFQKALKRLIQGLKDRDWKVIIEFMQWLQEAEYLGELLWRMLGAMDWLDWLLALGQLAVWIAAAMTTGGASVALKIAALGIDIIQLGVKLEHFFNPPKEEPQ